MFPGPRGGPVGPSPVSDRQSLLLSLRLHLLGRIRVGGWPCINLCLPLDISRSPRETLLPLFLPPHSALRSPSGAAFTLFSIHLSPCLLPSFRPSFVPVPRSTPSAMVPPSLFHLSLSLLLSLLSPFFHFLSLFALSSLTHSSVPNLLFLPGLSPHFPRSHSHTSHLDGGEGRWTQREKRGNFASQCDPRTPRNLDGRRQKSLSAAPSLSPVQQCRPPATWSKLWRRRRRRRRRQRRCCAL